MPTVMLNPNDTSKDCGSVICPVFIAAQETLDLGDLNYAEIVLISFAAPIDGEICSLAKKSDVDDARECVTVQQNCYLHSWRRETCD